MNSATDQPHGLPAGTSSLISPDVHVDVPFSARPSTRNAVHHPVQQIQTVSFRSDVALRDRMARDCYGKHFVEGLQHQRTSIAKAHAVSLLSQHHSLEVSLGTHQTISYDDYMAVPSQRVHLPTQNFHQAMEQQHNALRL